MPFATSHQWPEWVCVNCGRKFPQDTQHVKCPGSVDPATKQVERCGGYLLRWLSYQRKVG